MAQKFINNWEYPITAGISAGATSIPVDSAGVSRISDASPTNPYVLTLQEGGVTEIVRCTAASGSALTVARAQEATAAAAFSSAATISARITKGTLEALQSASGGGVYSHSPTFVGGIYAFTADIGGAVQYIPANVAPICELQLNAPAATVFSTRLLIQDLNGSATLAISFQDINSNTSNVNMMNSWTSAFHGNNFAIVDLFTPDRGTTWFVFRVV